MKILFVVPYAPTHIRVRPYNLIKNLIAHDNQLTLATLYTTEEERTTLQEFESLGVRVIAESLPRWRSFLNCLGALPASAPLQAVYCRSNSLRSRIADELRGAKDNHCGSYDVVHVEHLRGAQYGLDLRNVPVVWDSVDCISYLFEQASRDSKSLAGKLMTRLELGRTRRYEGWLVGQFDRTLVTSQTDKLALQDLAIEKTTSVIVLPNGVDLNYFSPRPELRESDSVVFTGKMSYHANVTAALHLVHQIMPIVWSERPQTIVRIVGANPHYQVRRLAEEFQGRVEVTGTVPDIRPYLRRATIAAAPILYRAGIQNKVLEAMACGAPVVATPKACGALKIIHEQDLLIASEPKEFAQMMLRGLQDNALASRIGATGRRYVEENHDWNILTAGLERTYLEAIHAPAV